MISAKVTVKLAGLTTHQSITVFQCDGCKAELREELSR